MEWVPTVFIVFKGTVLAIGMFFAIKWHYDQARKENGAAKQRAVLRAGVTVVVVFVVLLAVLLLLTFGLGEMLGIDLNWP
ncbi:hypothetical protein [Mitsuaria sp. GD03876]|uniref:hypothetical protein n=1 Tax=Mitsuaria sp. GD03876 TaxID=2975399 RepID=UPI00244BF861|nr:hypothetical protein [Mitsuaria sp. GD03876]MDH0865107.1 hypothetical protein [Mitsuaria sp. GD03876]